MRSRLLLAVLASLVFPCTAHSEPKTLPQDVRGGTAIGAASESSKVPADAGSQSGRGLAAGPLEGRDPVTSPADASATRADMAAEKPKPAPPSLVAKIDLSRQRMEVVVGGVSKYSWAISSGAQGHETPRGTFHAQWTAKLWHSQKYDLAPMPHAVFFHNGAAIHATTSVRLLGQPASHGCVRLAPANAAAFYALVQKHGLKGTQIRVFGQEPVPKIARREAPRPPTYNGQAVTYLPPGSPYAGRPSFVHNGVLYVKVR